MDYVSRKRSGKRREIDKEDSGGTHKVGGKTDELGALEARRESVQGGHDELESSAGGGRGR